MAYQPAVGRLIWVVVATTRPAVHIKTRNNSAPPISANTNTENFSEHTGKPLLPFSA
jgi:hypothetical protein